MKDEIIENKNVSTKYLKYRDQILNYTNEAMNLSLNSDEQVYIALFDIPIESGIIGFQTQSLALIFGLNTHLYHGSGSCSLELEKFPEVKRAMQSLLISSHQTLSAMELTNNFEFYNSHHIRAYLKTRRGVHYKELNQQTKMDKFLIMLLNHVLNEISKII